MHGIKGFAVGISLMVLRGRLLPLWSPGMWRCELLDQRRISIRKAKIGLLCEIGERPKIVQP
jgi:hypothetical protein